MCIRWEKGDAFPAGMCGVVEHPRALSAVIQMWFSGFSLGVCEGDVRNFFCRLQTNPLLFSHKIRRGRATKKGRFRMLQQNLPVVVDVPSGSWCPGGARWGSGCPSLSGDERAFSVGKPAFRCCISDRSLLEKQTFSVGKLTFRSWKSNVSFGEISISCWISSVSFVEAGVSLLEKPCLASGKRRMAYP